jgi:FKBP-type peptidyl-prolyl cis-trans isomerase
MLKLLLATAAASTYAKFNTGVDLPKDGDLRIGVKYVPECKAAGECPTSAKGDKLSMHYTGMLYKDASKFDSSLDRGDPFGFTLGQGQVIKGWDEGLMGMAVGEKRRLTIPSGKGYGDSGSGAKIPGGATLVFDVELLKIN